MKSFSNNKTLILIASIFMLITIFVVFFSVIVNQLDNTVLSHVFQLRNVNFTPIVIWVTDLLTPTNIVLTVTIMSMLIFLAKQSWVLSLWYAAVHIIGLLVINPGIKSMVSRTRPPVDFRLVHETSPSFPSGHSASVVLVTLMIVFALVVLFNLGKYKGILLTLAFALILFIGFSRLYLGVHYLTDVIAGYCVGLLCFGLGLKFYNHYI
ncbi:phosphatase PAP2 family protein [Aerococcaceae bacterium DSM 111176]|nr:phosphatase PAP2 family protein [Aerococcaceae bacterium DSM 111176]